MNCVVFLGPSLGLDEARLILPGALYLPPARQSDLLSVVVNDRPDVVGLIDGVFGQSLPVWHKEILFALERGVRVFGAASMGALRAVELQSFGMVGVGEVFRQYGDGELEDDAEVALVHDTRVEGYRALTLPMVNVRATVHSLVATGAIGIAESARIEAAAHAIFFAERTMTAVLERAGVADGVARAFRANYVDVKAADARLLLATLRDLQDEPVVGGAMVRSGPFERLYNGDRRATHADVNVPLHAIATRAALFEADFDALNFNALNRVLVQVLAEKLEVDVDDEEVAAEELRFRRRRAMSTPHQLDGWLRANDLDQDELRALMRELALCRRLHKWLLDTRVGSVRRRRWLLDELRLQGRYVAVAEATACALSAADATRRDGEGLAELTDDALVELVPAHQRATDWRLDVPIAEWAQEAGFDDLQDLAYALLQAARVREKLGE